jgi:hypothetical protein
MWNEVLVELKRQFADGPAALFHEFLSQGTRGFVQERRMPPSATLKLRRGDEDESTAAASTEGREESMHLKAKAG